MSGITETGSMALFCDFENIALGVQDAKYARFDMRLVLEKLLIKGSIIVKKAYCDWTRYKEFKPSMHEVAFELIEVPHVRQSGKNSADIRMVVDALDLCYTKPHVQTFVIISGDSDFSPLVSKLRENNKTVVGVGVKNSSSDLLVGNCDEFIFYDDLVRAQPPPPSRPPRRAPAARRSVTAAAPAVESAASPAATEAKAGGEDRTAEAFDLVWRTAAELMADRGGEAQVWGSMVKQTLRRRRPGFSEGYYGFKSFNALLEAAAAQGRLTLERDEKSGGYVITNVAG